MALLAFLQTLVLFFLVPKVALDQAVEQARAMHALPDFGLVLIQNIRWLALAFFGVSVFLVNAGMGLLQRKEWARKTLVALLVISIVVMLPGLFLHFDLNSLSVPIPEELRGGLDLMQNGLVAMNALFCVIHGWLAWKLSSRSIRVEFGACPVELNAARSDAIGPN